MLTTRVPRKACPKDTFSLPGHGVLIGRTVEAYVDDIVVKSRRVDQLVADRVPGEDGARGRGAYLADAFGRLAVVASLPPPPLTGLGRPRAFGDILHELP